MEGHERTYDFKQFLDTANTMNCLTTIEYTDNEMIFGRVLNELNNV